MSAASTGRRRRKSNHAAPELSAETFREMNRAFANSKRRDLTRAGFDHCVRNRSAGNVRDGFIEFFTSNIRNKNTVQRTLKRSDNFCFGAERRGVQNLDRCDLS